MSGSAALARRPDGQLSALCALPACNRPFPRRPIAKIRVGLSRGLAVVGPTTKSENYFLFFKICGRPCSSCSTSRTSSPARVGGRLRPCVKKFGPRSQPRLETPKKLRNCQARGQRRRDSRPVFDGRRPLRHGRARPGHPRGPTARMSRVARLSVSGQSEGALSRIGVDGGDEPGHDGNRALWSAPTAVGAGSPRRGAPSRSGSQPNGDARTSPVPRQKCSAPQSPSDVQATRSVSTPTNAALNAETTSGAATDAAGAER